MASQPPPPSLLIPGHRFERRQFVVLHPIYNIPAQHLTTGEQGFFDFRPGDILNTLAEWQVRANPNLQSFQGIITKPEGEYSFAFYENLVRDGYVRELVRGGGRKSRRMRKSIRKTRRRQRYQ